MMHKYVISYKNGIYPLKVIRYVSYTLTDKFWVFIKKNKGNIDIYLESIDGKPIDKKKIKKIIDGRIKEELIRENIFQRTKELREYLIHKALTYTPPSSISEIEEGLTKEEEEELERLIKEIEEEIKKESKDEIKKTWEERHGN